MLTYNSCFTHTCDPIAGSDNNCHPPRTPSCPGDGDGFGGALQSSRRGGADLEAPGTSLIIDDGHQ